MNKPLLLLFVALPAWNFGDSARAQSIDYGASELLFGEPVTASVTGKPQRAADAPANIEIITQDDIRRSGATSIPEILQFIPGIDVRQTSTGNADVGIRGYNQSSNPHLMVLVDGRQVYMVDYGRIIWSAIPVQLDEIRQIEVIKGPNSALYGFNAVSGVINIITYDPLKDHLNSATVRAGTGGYLSGSAVGTGQIGDTAGLRLSLGGFRANDYPQGNLSAGDHQAREAPFTGTFNADGRWQVTPNVEVFADSSVGDTRLPDQAPPGVFQTETLVGTSLRAGLRADTALGLFSLSGYRSDARVSIYDIGLAARGAVALGEYQTTYVFEASDLMKLGADHSIRFGVEYRRNADQSGSLILGSISNDIYSASLMWDWQMTPTLSLTNAVRVDHLLLHFTGALLPTSGLTNAAYNATTLTEPSFNSGLVWKMTDEDTLRLSLARGEQLPTLLEYALQIPAGFYNPLVSYAGRPDIAPSIVWNAEVDYDRGLPAIASVLRTALFVQRIDDINSWPFGAPLSFSLVHAPVFFSDNVGYSTAAGVELELKGHSESGFRWNASYALVSTTDHTPLDQGPVLTGTVDYAHSTPDHVLIGGVGYTRDKWELDLRARWQSSYLDFRLNPARRALQAVNIDNYITMNARIGYRVTDNLTVALSAQQFNQSQLVESAGPPVQRQIILSVSVHL